MNDDVRHGPDVDLLDIAVIGMAGRFPGASSVDEFWENLRNGVEGISRFTEEELVEAGVSSDLLSNAHYVKAAPVLDDVDAFDAGFFGINPREAALMDPQHRLFIECAWEALESGGYDPGRYPGAIGVYAGMSRSEYSRQFQDDPELDELQVELSNGKDFLATKLSYKLNLRGPSVSVQTACSTSLVATHMACRALIGGECSMALAGGASVTVPHRVGYLYEEAGILSPDGHCRPFDELAQGTLRGSGVAVVLLKRMADALRDGDCIRAVIKGSAINNDGARKAGFTAPSVEGQAEAIATALAVARVEPHSVQFIEGHGTATPVGDPIELAALAKVFGTDRVSPQSCAVGSVKSHVGHLDVASGLTGLIKTVLSLENRLLIPNLHFQRVNPRAHAHMTPFYVPTAVKPWDRANTPRRAGVSAFGIGGTNAHVILEEAPVRPAAAPTRRSAHLVTLSAKTGGALDRLRLNLVAHLAKSSGANLADVCYTLHTGRGEFSHRLAAVGVDRADLVDSLGRKLESRVIAGVAGRDVPAVVFLFPGHGAQYVGMARSFYDTEPSFRNEVDCCAEILGPLLGHDIRTSVFPLNSDPGHSSWQPDDMAVSQPALFIVEYALARLWQEWGIRPAAMLGHSIGEYTAACLAGVLSLEDALRIVALRGRLFSSLPEGAMLVVPLAEAEIRPRLSQELSVAAVNGPGACVVAGPPDPIGRLERELAAEGLDTQRVRSTRAAHSAMLDPVLPTFRSELRQIALHAPTMPYVSSLTGSWITAEEVTDPEYWVQHLRQTVRFADAVSLLLAQPRNVFLEVGPGRTLSTLLRQQLAGPHSRLAVCSLRHPKDEVDDGLFLLKALGQLWCSGVPVSWTAFHAHEQRQRVVLPTYPFERDRYWIDGKPRSRAPDAGSAAGGPLPRASNDAEADQDLEIREDIADWFYVPSWRRLPLTRWLPPAGSPRSWLILGDRAGVGTRIGTELRRSGHRVTIVHQGDLGGVFTCSERQESLVCSMDPADQSHYEALLQALDHEGNLPDAIVHCWSVDALPGTVQGQEHFERQQTNGSYSLLKLTQALGRRCVGRPMTLWVLSTGVQDVTGDEMIDPAKASVLGACKIVPQEYTNIGCHHVDLAAGSTENPELIEWLLGEIHQATTESAIAYRGPHRWVQRFEPVSLEVDTAHTGVIREGGVYLITGGLGHVGLILAEHLARTARARLALTTRGWLPPSEQWTAWLAEHDAGDSVAQRIQAVRSLQALGAEVLVYSADVSDRQRMAAVLDELQRRWGGLHGIIHAAGIIAPETYTGIRETTEADLQRHARPKVHGAYVLADLTRDMELDFCVLMSSLSTVLGGLRHLSYVSANLFLDSLAHTQNRLSRTRWTSINWDAWENIQGWGSSAQEALAHLSIRAEEGTEAFRRILGAHLVQVAVSTFGLEGRLANPLGTPTRSTGSPQHRLASGGNDAAPEPESFAAVPGNEIEQKVARVWQHVLGINQVGLDENFLDVGGDSFLGIQVLSRLRSEFQVDISVDTIFTAPTVSELAVAIESLLSSEAEAVSVARGN